ncbi:MAG: hypothetical protein M0006_13025 [Magnetospirillum sp.]|nr:hypothetical protein [Magnetospirillum sp.]
MALIHVLPVLRRQPAVSTPRPAASAAPVRRPLVCAWVRDPAGRGMVCVWRVEAQDAPAAQGDKRFRERRIDRLAA